MSAIAVETPVPVRPTEWSSGPCSALGYRFELRVPRESDFVRVFSQMVAGFQTQSPQFDRACYHLRPRTEPAADQMPYGLYHGSRCIGAGRTAADFTKCWGWNLNRAVIGSATSDFVLLHAACVTRAGVTVLLPAEMESGKTTTTAGLLREGYAYVTDEAAAIDPATGQVVPFPKPLSLDPGSWHLFPELRVTHASRGRNQWQVTSSDLGAATETQPVAPPRVVVFPSYDPSGPTRVEPLRPSDALLELSRMSFGFARRPARAFAALSPIAQNARCVRLYVGDLDSAVTAIDQLVSTAFLEDL